MKKSTLWLILSVAIIGLAAAGCTLEKAAYNRHADTIKDAVAVRYDRFAASGGEVCEQ